MLDLLSVTDVWSTYSYTTKIDPRQVKCRIALFFTMMGWFVYLVRCHDGSLYTGVTTDPPSRVRAHNAGRGARYTRVRGPVRLVHLEVAAGRAAALRREWMIKQWSRAGKERLVSAGVRTVRGAAPKRAGGTMVRTLRIGDRIRVEGGELRFQYARSAGAGGQNVNKVSSKAILRWSVSSAPGLPPDVRERFLRRFARRITRDGDLVLASQRFRDQRRNVEDCLDKLTAMLAQVAEAPAPRRPTRPGRASAERRLRDKRTRSAIKSQRARPDDRDSS
ncbi:MAG TPA: alternative ribosome rescue aminoacyl-tRNA hydrolase ArfB [Candidatus Polarisedimenticolia bacterium]|nr:alternative ribosome rescue aminoacyl-tRNA hydrolase ArfB [Candidatus Polarisedimenticolia bacterium]